MKKVIYNTIIGGVFFLIPLFVVLKILGVILKFFKNLGPKITEFLELPALGKFAGSSFTAGALILLICFLFGLLAKWSKASKFRNWFDEQLTRIFPMYSHYRIAIEQGLSVKDKPLRPVVLVPFESGWRPGLITEHLENGKVCVFLPMAPRFSDGTLIIVTSDSLVPLNIDEKKLNELLLLSGKGFENITFAKSV